MRIDGCVHSSFRAIRYEYVTQRAFRTGEDVVIQGIGYDGEDRDFDFVAGLALGEAYCLLVPVDMVNGQVSDILAAHPRIDEQETDGTLFRSDGTARVEQAFRQLRQFVFRKVGIDLMRDRLRPREQFFAGQTESLQGGRESLQDGAADPCRDPVFAESHLAYLLEARNAVLLAKQKERGERSSFNANGARPQLAVDFGSKVVNEEVEAVF